MPFTYRNALAGPGTTVSFDTAQPRLIASGRWSLVADDLDPAAVAAVAKLNAERAARAYQAGLIAAAGNWDQPAVSTDPDSGYRGTWDRGTAYHVGDLVRFGDAVYGAVTESTGAEPEIAVDVLTDPPVALAVADGGDYELVAYIQVTRPVPVTDLCFYKSALQVQSPHVLSLWDRDISLTTPIAKTSAGQESPDYAGVVAAPLSAVLLPGRRYAVSIKTGTGSDTGYARTTGVTLPIVAGPVIVTAAGFSSVVGSIATVTTGTTLFPVWLRWVDTDPAWELLGRTRDLVAGDTRTVALTQRPDPLACRPNDGTGYWADNSNTGARGTPVDYTTGMVADGWVPVQVADETVIEGKLFTGKAGIGYDGQGDMLIFRDCVFEGTLPNDNLVQIYCPTLITFINCTFKPATLDTPPDNDGSVSTAAVPPGTEYADSWQSIARMVPGQSVFIGCNIWGGAAVQCTGGVDRDHVTVFRGCYVHDCADTDNSGAPEGFEYHHDGLGPDSEGDGHDTLIEHCTIASLGTTNGIALQGSSGYSRVTIRGCYLSGWGYAVAIGATSPWEGTHITVEDNVFSAEVETLFGPLYGHLWNDGDGTNIWRRNRYQVRDGDAAAAWTTADHGAYWWPTDDVGHPGDYTG